MSQDTYKKLENVTKERLDALRRQEEAERERAMFKREADGLKHRVWLDLLLT